ncbi:MAG: 1-acyl-sn-glycerol-3-phosphate acyltransferase [Burkholderiales bacterium]|nr:1-acyl-sn-glycerol-3-phosphate acyltransferase [Burkholderiales bacterium]MBI3729939.1 1-acyl-sn-glycerol-3-phosphate acyltransferase [Burkholderiales bacterium]
MINIQSLAPQKSPIFIRVLKSLMSLLGKVTVTGSEHLNGPLGKVVVCNHVGWVDPLWVGYAALPRTLHQMAKKELFDNPISGWFVRSGGGFPVDRSNPSTATIKHAVSLVEQGCLVLIFPVGTRNQDNADAKRGAATIALRAKGEIVPAHYDGPERFRLIHLLRRPLIHITFGTPVIIPKDVSANKATAQQLTNEIDQAMKIVSQQGRPI